MAAIRSRVQPSIGSAQWVQDENAQVSAFCRQEAEDFTFSARNEVEWLNEHMAEIFSKDQINVTDVFKTPGKLKGKTPRTARKRNPLETREPLSNIFSTNARSSPIRSPLKITSKAASPAKGAQFKVAEDPPATSNDSHEPGSIKDSGYHGLPEDDMDIDVGPVQSISKPQSESSDFPLSPNHQKDVSIPTSTDRSTTEPSFHSAKEDITKKDVIASAQVQPSNKDNGASPENMDLIVSNSRLGDEMEIDVLGKEDADNVGIEESRSSSQESSPARGLVRKSSLTFAALPAREPITTKKSIGTRISQTNTFEPHKSANMQSSLMERLTGGKSLGGVKQFDAQGETLEDGGIGDRPQPSREESDSDSRMTKLHNKSSTQRLHERINLLGKSQPPRPTKSIPTLASIAQPEYPDLTKEASLVWNPAAASVATSSSNKNDEDDDWIQPPHQINNKLARPPLSKSVSADTIEGHKSSKPVNERQIERQNLEGGRPTAQPSSRPPNAVSSIESLDLPTDKRHRAIDTGEPAANEKADPVNLSVTPVGQSAEKWYVDGSLDASKTKLQSIMKTARGLFSSSASVSAQAKMDVMSPSLAPQTDTLRSQDPFLSQKAVPNTNESEAQIGSVPAQAVEVASVPEPRKTRSSTEKEAKEKQKEFLARQQTEKAREVNKQQDITLQAEFQSNHQRKSQQQSAANPRRQSLRKTQPREDYGDREPTTANSTVAGPGQGRQSQIHRSKDIRRPTKPAKETANQPKAPPVNIRIGMPSRRVPLNNTNLSSSLHESLHASSKPPGISKKASNASMQSTASAPKNPPPAGKPKALIAAERKKEQDEREAQRKLEQKREIERKRAAQQEEARRQEQLQRQEVEKQREKERIAATDDPKKLAQKQVIEKRRIELQKKDQRAANKIANENSHGAIHHEQIGSTQRHDLGGNRPPSRQANVPDRQKAGTVNHQANPPKPPIKRVFDPESDSAPLRPSKPHTGQNFQQTDSKRRRTEDEDQEEFPTRPTMAPPIRQSGIRKDGLKTSIFSHTNYNPAPPPAVHHTHANSLLKSTTTSQAYQQHLYQGQQSRQPAQADTFKYRDGNKIPFAENPNPPQHQQPPSNNQHFKTPLPSKSAHPSRHQSPQYPNGENIQLQEIPTDSEDSDSSPDTAQKRQRAASLPDWVQSPYLNNLLRSQEEYMDPDAVFGPVGSPHLEEMFRERAHKFRPRTSSANWAGQDRLTQEEIRRDAEARARIRKEGGWSYGGTT